MKAQILVRLKDGVLDVQGKAIEGALGNAGNQAVRDIRVGKLIELDVEAGSEDEARGKIDEVCKELLVNAIIEQYEVVLLS